MKLLFSGASPFVRKVMVLAHEIGISDRIEPVTAAAHPIKRDASLVALNPLGKVPTLTTDDGTVLYDSRVICEYLDAEHGGGRMFPAGGAARWRVLARQALADGLLDAAILSRYEGAMRTENERSEAWLGGQLAKIDSSLDAMEADADSLGSAPDMGTIATACALGYLDFRFADRDWRARAPKLAAWFEAFATRPSMKATEPKG